MSSYRTCVNMSHSNRFSQFPVFVLSSHKHKPRLCSCRHSLWVKMNVWDLTASTSDITNPPFPPRCWALFHSVWLSPRSSESLTHWCDEQASKLWCEASHCYLSSEPGSGEFGGEVQLKRWNMTHSLRLHPPSHPHPRTPQHPLSLDSPALNMTNDKGTPRAVLWQHKDPQHHMKNYPTNLWIKSNMQTSDFTSAVKLWCSLLLG